MEVEGMSNRMTDAALQQLFTEARSHHAWTERAVDDETLRELFELMKWGPTSVNSMPARIVFIRSAATKARLAPALMGSNREQVAAAPVVALVGYDENFHNNLKRLMPSHGEAAIAYFEGDAKMRLDTAFRNSSLQGAYLILAARALGLDTCPMSGFDNNLVDQSFFAGTSLRSNFLCTLGYGDHSKLWPRGPRLSFEEVCELA
jgi:3-hydroxypropanoate dehydrogenase